MNVRRGAIEQTSIFSVNNDFFLMVCAKKYKRITFGLLFLSFWRLTDFNHIHIAEMKINN